MIIISYILNSHMSPEGTPPKPNPVKEILGKEPPVDMVGFRQKIAALVERRHNGDMENLRELLDIGPSKSKMDEQLSELTETDAVMWEKVRNHEKSLLTEDEFKSYQKEVMRSEKVARIAIMHILASKIFSRFF